MFPSHKFTTFVKPLIKVTTHLWRYPGRVIHLALLLEAELGVCHVDPGHQLVVGHAVDL